MNSLKNTFKQKGHEVLGWIILSTVIIWGVAAWITHIVYCLSTEAWGFLIAGAIVFPIAIVHGTGLWFVAW